jgi:hypothetical protein
MVATQPMEISSPLGSGTVITIRAGGLLGKNSLKRRLSSAKLETSATSTVVFTTKSSLLRPARRIKILERLPSLNVEGRTNRFARRRVNTWLPRYEQQASRMHCLGIGSNRLQSRNLDHAFIWHAVSS